MNEEKPNGQTPLDTDPVPLTTETPSKNPPTANEQDGIRKDLSEFETVSADIQRKNLAATRVIAVVTALYMGFAALQWWTMRNQLKEMKGGSADTHNLAAATGSYAADMKRLAEQTTSQAAQTKLLAEAARKSAATAEKSEAATEQLARATSDAAAASHNLAESAGQSSAATQRLASAANDANAVSRELVKATQQAGGVNRNVARAYVFATDIKLNPILSPIPPQKPIGWTANVTWENTGNTPTNDLIISASCWSAGMSTAANGPQVPKQPYTFDVSTIAPDDRALIKIPDEPHLIGPKSTKHSVGCIVGPIEAIFTGVGLTFYYYSFGTAKYRDVFGASHRTDFCFVFRLTGSGEFDYMDKALVTKAGIKPLDMEAASCQKHNCADEECNADPLKLVAVAPSEPEPLKPPAKPPG